MENLKLLKIDNYWIVVSDEKIKTNDWVYYLHNSGLHEPSLHKVIKTNYSDYKPYNYIILQIFEFKELTEENCIKTFELENSLKEVNILNRYKPQKQFGGRYECFNKILQ